MSTDNKYNGWTNYETWNVALWMGESGNYYDEIAQEVAKGADSRDDAVYLLSKEMEFDHEENMPELNGTYSDLLSAALRAVNWYEIAEHYIDDNCEGMWQSDDETIAEANEVSE